MSEIDERAVLTVPEAAKALRISPRSYYQAASRGEVPVTKVGRRLIVSGAALRRFVDGGDAVAIRRPEQDLDEATDWPLSLAKAPRVSWIAAGVSSFGS